MKLADNLIKAGKEAKDLDELVHESAALMATHINNNGLYAQLNYLLSIGWSEEEILKKLGVPDE
jgi:hypothetical protein